MVQPSNRKRNRKKLQSAMEYLTTYGWAVLVIMIVLVVLFKLGVFSSGNYGPRATPGSCQVSRPNGPYSNIFMKLQGVCTGLIPQYAATFDGATSQISGNVPAGETMLTVSFWASLSRLNVQQNFLNLGGNANHLVPYVTNANIFRCWTTSADLSSGVTLSAGTWYFLTCAYDGGTLYIYVNGVQKATTPLTGFSTTANVFMFGADQGSTWTKGTFGNVQIYNTSLSTNEIQTQYVRGIGGAPIKPQNLVGWWPLNGDTNDYSGNGNGGVPTNVVFTTSWTSGYTVP